MDDKVIQPFLVNVQGDQTGAQTPSQIHQYLANKLRSEVFQTQWNSPADILSIPRYSVISIKKYEGTPLLYKRLPHDKSETNKMKVSEQLLMHSLVYGRLLRREKTLEQIENPQILYTQFSDTNFALTEFNHGTLHFMQEFSRNPELSEKKLDCMGNNICTFLRMVFILYHSYTYTMALQDSQLSIKANALFKDNIKHHIEELYRRYKNKFCYDFYRNHGGLKAFIQ
jgi:hypothetical protein